MVNKKLRDYVIGFWTGITLSTLGVLTSGVTVTMMFLQEVELEEVLTSNLYAALVSIDFSLLVVGFITTIVCVIIWIIDKIKQI